LAHIIANKMNVILAIDGGGSRTRCMAIDRNGRVAGSGESGPSNHLLVERETVVSSLSAVIDEALTHGGLNRDEVVCLSAGLAGVDYDGSGAAEMEAVFRALGFDDLVINSDMVIAHAGALSGRPGVLALAGTGSAILGIDANGRRVKVGGWGPVYGDEGSAYRIAQSALTAAAKAYDGRGPRTELLPAITQALGLREFKETVARIYIEKMEPREIAALSRAVYETAEAGDEFARNIFLQAGADLAEGVAAALRRLNLTDEQRIVSYQGSVLAACASAREQFSEKLRQQFPGISVTPPSATPVIGAYLLGCEALGWPLLFDPEKER
jgi:N-acetylglucosamine kinase-like BadF-type ATPase